VTWSNKKHHRRPHGDPSATERVFVNAEGVKRAYKFKPSDSRVLEEPSLERQLNRRRVPADDQGGPERVLTHRGRAPDADVPGGRPTA
jgi:hypothetical protein